MSASTSHSANYPTKTGVSAALDAFRAPGDREDHP